MSDPVPRAGRVLDVVGVSIFLVGAAFYARAWVGLQRLQDGFQPPPDAPPFAAIARYHELTGLSRMGLAVMAAGVVVAVAAAVVARRLRR